MSEKCEVYLFANKKKHTVSKLQHQVIIIVLYRLYFRKKRFFCMKVGSVSFLVDIYFSPKSSVFSLYKDCIDEYSLWEEEEVELKM